MLQHSGLENRTAQENIFNIIKIVAKHYAKHETKFRKKSFGKWYLNENLI